jgi:hypothetical protein
MKTFKDYLTESKKVYSFKVKVAGEIPESFEDRLKERLGRCKVVAFEKLTTTPVQKVPLDFPMLSNKEVTIYEVVTEYPITAPEISRDIKELGMMEDCFRVRGSAEPTEQEQALMDDETAKKIDSLLSDSTYKETTNAKHKDYFGDDFNRGFLKDLAKAAKERTKEEGKGEYKLPKAKTDKAGTKSALGS